MDERDVEAGPAVELKSQIEDFLLLQRAAQRITSILDLDVLLELIVDDVAETFGCSRSGILLVDEETRELELVAVRGWTINYHVKGDRFKFSEGMIGHVASTARTCYAPDVTKDPNYLVSEESTRSEVDIPIMSRGKLIGVFSAQDARTDAFPPHRLEILEALTGHIGIAIENARLFGREQNEKTRMERELAEARSIQARLFPDVAPELPTFRMSGLSEPCLSVGGDWYDYIPLASGQVAVVLGDVAGKGTGAALLMASTRSTVRMYAEQGGSPGEVLARVNSVLVGDLPSAKFVTMIYVVLDPASRKITFAGAGHLPPILVDESGARAIRVTPELPLGIRNGSYVDNEMVMAPGSRLFLYSDGVTEARNATSEDYGEERLRRYAASPTASAQGLRDDVLRFTKDHPVADDITVVMVEALD